MRKKTGNKLHTWEAALLLAVAAALLWGGLHPPAAGCAGAEGHPTPRHRQFRQRGGSGPEAAGAGSGAGAGGGHPAPVGETWRRPGSVSPRRCPGCSRRRRRRSPLRAADTPSAPGWRRRSFLHGSMTALHYPPGSIWLCGWSSGEGAGKNWWCVVFPPLCTTAACDFQETAVSGGLGGGGSVPHHRGGRRLRPAVPGGGALGGPAPVAGESTERRGRPAGGVGEKIPYGMLNLYSSEIYDT